MKIRNKNNINNSQYTLAQLNREIKITAFNHIVVGGNKHNDKTYKIIMTKEKSHTAERSRKQKSFMVPFLPFMYNATRIAICPSPLNKRCNVAALLYVCVAFYASGCAGSVCLHLFLLFTAFSLFHIRI